MNPADVLDAAADLLWLRGRCVGTGADDDGHLCPVGALFIAALPCVSGDRQALNALTLFVGEFIPDWNDRHPVTPENDALIVDTLRRCSKELRESACS